MIDRGHVDAARAALGDAGFLAPDDEARLLAEAAGGDAGVLAALVRRRATGEPLAWITGTTTFCGEQIRVDPGVYVPRPQSEPLAEAAAARLPGDGIAVDLCTGSGAIAVVLARRHPGARVIGVDVDPVAVAGARANGVEAHLGDLADAVPDDVVGRVDVVTGVVPYVPTDALHLLPRDVRVHEPRTALDGGPGGTAVLTRAVVAAAGLLRPGGHLLLELGGDQDVPLVPALVALGFTEVMTTRDPEGDLRTLQATSPAKS